MAGMMLGYYNIYPLVWDDAPNARMSVAMTQMPGMMQGLPAAAGRVGRRYPNHMGIMLSPPYMDLLSADNPVSTQLETQFTGIETFFFEELGLSPVRDSPTEMPTAAGRRGARVRAGQETRDYLACGERGWGGAGEEEEGSDGRKRTV